MWDSSCQGVDGGGQKSVHEQKGIAYEGVEAVPCR